MNRMSFLALFRALFRVIFVNRVISGYSRESCYFGYFGSFQVISVRILNFGVFRFMELIFLIFHAEADTCWSARCARSGLVVSNSIFFSDLWVNS